MRHTIRRVRPCLVTASSVNISSWKRDESFCRKSIPASVFGFCAYGTLKHRASHVQPKDIDASYQNRPENVFDAQEQQESLNEGQLEPHSNWPRMMAAPMFSGSNGFRMSARLGEFAQAPLRLNPRQWHVPVALQTCWGAVDGRMKVQPSHTSLIEFYYLSRFPRFFFRYHPSSEVQTISIFKIERRSCRLTIHVQLLPP